MSSTPHTDALAAAVPRTAAVTAAPARLLSLDVFRGLSVAGMILVNNPGSWGYVYAPLQHAAWNGWTPTDLIFPFFVFIVGVSMTFSLGHAIERGAKRRELLLKTLRRALLIIGAGVALHAFIWWSYDQPHLRIPGVLQRIGVVYLLAAGIYLYTRARGQIVAVIALLFGYWGLLTLVPVPGGSAGVLEPGKDLGAYLDRVLFTTNHLWQRRAWDPEGFLSTLPAIATALLGGLTGTWLRSSRAQLEKAAGLFVMGSLGMAAGIVWDGLFPINKNLWTSSYVVFTAGLACHLLAICYYLVDIKGAEIKGFRTGAAPFVAYGSNAIAAYLLSSIVAVLLDNITVGGGDLKAFVFTQYYLSWLEPFLASLLFASTYVLLWLGFVTLLYQRRIFIKL